LQLLGTAFRKNISGKDLPIGVNDEVIPKDAFVAYALADVHQDPLVYKEPEKWDPARYLPDRAEDKKKPYSYLGWGAGRHPCLGMRVSDILINS
jgi:cytochrome P450